MREIKFRGKIADPNKFIYGYFLKIKKPNEEDIACIIEKESHFLNNEKLVQDYFKVLPNMVGQYTGLDDNNGKEIYDGDIVEFETIVNCIKEKIKPYWKDCYEKQYAIGGGTWWVRKDQAVVQWNSKDGMWDLKVYNNGKYKRKSKLCTYRESGYVVIGNIYDTPELLEGKDELL